jgi:PAS domain S-box-containing protein
MKSLWELLWDYDPNGLVVVDSESKIKVVNPAFCNLFKSTTDDLLEKSATELLGDMSDFEQVRETGEALVGIEKEYPDYDIFLRKVIFPVKEEGMVACIMVDMTREWKQRNEMAALKRETLMKVHAMVDKQMAVAQKIAGLLGETTAETKVSLLKLLKEDLV